MIKIARLVILIFLTAISSIAWAQAPAIAPGNTTDLDAFGI